METMVERCVARLRANGAEGTDDELASDVLAMLEEIRKPTNAMLIAAMQGTLDYMAEKGITAISPFEDYPKPQEQLERCMGFMVDAALSEQSQAQSQKVGG